MTGSRTTPRSGGGATPAGTSRPPRRAGNDRGFRADRHHVVNALENLGREKVRMHGDQDGRGLRRGKRRRRHSRRHHVVGLIDDEPVRPPAAIAHLGSSGSSLTKIVRPIVGVQPDHLTATLFDGLDKQLEDLASARRVVGIADHHAHLRAPRSRLPDPACRTGTRPSRNAPMSAVANVDFPLPDVPAKQHAAALRRRCTDLAFGIDADLDALPLRVDQDRHRAR